MSPSSGKSSVQVAIRTEQELLEALHANIESAVVVTSTVRAARGLRRQYDEWQHDRGNAGWMTPSILAWEPWLGTQWDAAMIAGADNRVLLTDAQELEIWNKVLAKDAAAEQTLSIEAMTELAQRAWKQMHQYRIPPGRLRGESSLDTQAFYRWTTEFEKVCWKSSFLSPALLEAVLAKWIESTEAPLPTELFLVGFDRITSAQTLLVDTLMARDCSVQFVELQPEHASGKDPTIVYAHTLEEEIASAAHWIRDTLICNPAQRIGVVVPSLDETRGAIDRTFRQLLAPSSMDIRTRDAALPYEFSLGTPMFRLQPVRTALTLLRWLWGAIPQEEISWLAVQGGFGARSNGSQDARARLDTEFRGRDFQLGGPVSLSGFRQWLAQCGCQEESTPMRQTLERVVAAARAHALEKPRSFAEWGETIEELLSTARWHLMAPDTSADYQLLHRWSVLLSDLSSLSSVSGPVKFLVVLEKLEHLAAHMLFSLETTNAPVQIMGIAESAGLVFDSIWWLNARASAWPSRGKAQPFLPWNLQREVHMPYADPTEDSAFALRTTKRVVNSGATVVVSFALEDVDQKNSSAHIPDREVLLSPLIREVWPETSMIPVEEFLPEEPHSTTSASDIALETIQEEPAIPFEGTKVRGGVRFLELQAACPFRSFAELRLGTRPLAELSTGLSPAAQGTIIHRVLEGFWKEMKSQKNLLEKPPEKVEENLRRHIDLSLAKFRQNTNEPWQQALLQIEAERLELRLLEWLEQEKQRAEFTVAETENALNSPKLGGIEFECRVDRVDRVAQGIALLDYKTGRIERGVCEGDRPDQPQLPAYAILRNHAPEDALAGVAFASLHPRNIGFSVVGSLPSVFSMCSPDSGDDDPAPEARRRSKSNPAALSGEEMQSQEEAWRATLTRLAEEFRAGVVLVDPKKQGETCRYCEQSLLCRIREAAGTLANGPGEEASEHASARGDFE